MPSEAEREQLFALLLEKGKAKGEEISSALGISRPTISRRVKELNSLGFFIDAEEEGYSIPSNERISEISAYLKRLRSPLSYNSIYLEACESSQDIAEEMAKRGAVEGSLVICGEIKSAKGRLGRKWHAERGGLWFSLVLRPPIFSTMNLIPLAMGYSVAMGIEDILGITAEVKWPNDVLVNERKVCGILSEAKIEYDMPSYVILGVGVNANNELPEDLRQIATTLKELYGKEVPIIPLLGRILHRFSAEYEALKENNYKKNVLKWKSKMSTIGKRVRVVFRDEIIEGKAVDLSSDGSLAVQLDTGEKVKVYAGDVVHLRSE